MVQSAIQSVDRALRLLWEVRDNPGISLATASANVGLIPSTALRLLATLESHGLVERDALTRGFRVGPATLTLAAARSERADLAQTLEPVVRRLSLECREQVSLGVLEEAAVVHVVTVDGAASAGEEVLLRQPGRRAYPNLYATAQGKVLIAYADEPVAEALIAQQTFQQTASATITDPAAFRDHLATVRRNGYALSVNENSDHARGVAAPVRDASGAVVAALAVHGPTIRLPRNRLRAFVPALNEAARECSRLLGFALSREQADGQDGEGTST
jgi:DNA-binding IclR family transcriptional regulator